MRDHSHPEGLAHALPAAGYATNTSAARTGESPPQRRRSREELAAAQQRAQSRVQGQVQRQMDQERRARMRQAQQRREQRLHTLPARPLLVPYGRASALVAVLVFVLGGAFFEASLGGHFLYVGSAVLRGVTPWLVLAAIPVWIWALCRMEAVVPRLTEDMPAWFVRRMVAYPFAALLGAGAVGAAPWGWAAYLGHLSGRTARMEVRVVSVEAPRLSGSCNQHALVEYRGAPARVCTQTAVTGVVPRVGDAVVLAGRVSRWGVHVDSVHAK